ncbi:MAG: hypothetical protein IVW54_18690 [Candidatus Binataceae bacterium]|nr:hypothetical protein [Candidatus Binataceae bacterium]
MKSFKGKLVASLLTITAASVLSFGRPAFAAFSNSSLVGPYTYQANGFFTDNDGETGHLTLSGVLVFTGAGNFTVSPSGLTLTGLTTGLTGSNNFTGQGGDVFTCTPTVTSGTYIMDPDGVFTLTFNFTAANTCLGNGDLTTNTQIVAKGNFVPGNVGATSNVVSTTFTVPNLIAVPETGISFPEQGVVPDSATATEIITGLGLNGTLTRQ